ncbi:MAG: O-methyltransferase [Bacteroidetes bacterium]|nr:O-methyltransferase [bacterium]NBP63651.1 O-methyltransferase [Bacteroidota bacterium]
MATIPTLMNEALSHYAEQYFSSENEELKQLLHEAELAGIPSISIGGVQGAFLQILIHLIDAKTVVEIGSLAGYSAITMALAMKDGGIVHCYEKESEFCEFIKMQSSRMNIQDRICIHDGDASNSLQTDIPKNIDMIFIDADKPSYIHYAELLIPSLRSGGLLIGDNALAWGYVADEHPEFEPENVRGIQAFNQFVIKHSALYSPAIVPLGDGMCIAIKK